MLCNLDERFNVYYNVLSMLTQDLGQSTCVKLTYLMVTTASC